MRNYFLLCGLLLLTLSSCLTIVQSLVTPHTIITDDRIEGQWIAPDSKNILVQKFMKSKARNIFSEIDHKDYTVEDSVFFTQHYVISYKKSDFDYSWFAGIVKIKDQFYLNLEPGECLDNNGKDIDYPGKESSTIAKLEWKNNNSLVLHFLNGNLVKQIILNGNARIKHEYDPLFGTFVITASSSELTEFLEKYGNNETLFKGGETFVLVRKI